ICQGRAEKKSGNVSLELVGKTIVVVANLKPAKLMGVESRGMLLATDTEGGLTLLGFDRPPKTGAKIR
ncbi:MAG: hypothetical protein AAB112_05910, partial [Thermodesulfobacteriota bacterium]